MRTPEQPLSYNKHLAMTNALQQAANITISKKTHAPRGSGARNADVNGYFLFIYFQFIISRINFFFAL